MIAEVADDVVDLRERDPVAEALLGAEDRQNLALIVGRVRAPERLLRDRGGAEVSVVQDRPLVAGRDERRRQVGLPDPLGEPGTARPAAEHALELVRHPDELADPVALRQRGEDRLVPAAADDLDLAAIDEGRQALEKLRPLGPHPGQQRAGVVEGEMDRRVALDRFEHRLVGTFEVLGDDPAEVAHGLMVVERQGERDATGQAIPRWAHVCGRPATIRRRTDSDSTVLTLRRHVW